MICNIKNPQSNETLYRFNNNIFKYVDGNISKGSPLVARCRKSSKPITVFRGNPMLAKEYKDFEGNPNEDVIGWWMSEKYDGYRAIWNGRCFKSRTNNKFSVPRWFSQMMPQGVALDGELWMGRGKFNKCGLFRRIRPKNTAARKEWEKNWAEAGVIYKVFDIPDSPLKFEDRMKKLKTIIYNQITREYAFKDDILIKTFPLEFTEQIKIESRYQLENKFTNVVSNNGEGLILREPNSIYEYRRSPSMLKYKLQADMECKIVGYKKGTGVNKGRLGSFSCQFLNSDIIFTVGGMNTGVRKSYKKTHKINTVITIQYNGFTSGGKPRHPRYLRKRFKV